MMTLMKMEMREVSKRLLVKFQKGLCPLVAMAKKEVTVEKKKKKKEKRKENKKVKQKKNRL